MRPRRKRRPVQPRGEHPASPSRSGYCELPVTRRRGTSNTKVRLKTGTSPSRVPPGDWESRVFAQWERHCWWRPVDAVRLAGGATANLGHAAITPVANRVSTQDLSSTRTAMAWQDTNEPGLTMVATNNPLPRRAATRKLQQHRSLRPRRDLTRYSRCLAGT